MKRFIILPLFVLISSALLALTANRELDSERLYSTPDNVHANMDCPYTNKPIPGISILSATDTTVTHIPSSFNMATYLSIWMSANKKNHYVTDYTGWGN